MRQKIQSHIQTRDPQRYQEFTVSVKQDESQWHQHVLQAVGWLLDTIQHESGQQLPLTPLADTDDLFLLRRSVLA